MITTMSPMRISILKCIAVNSQTQLNNELNLTKATTRLHDISIKIFIYHRKRSLSISITNNSEQLINMYMCTLYLIYYILCIYVWY